MDWDENSEEEVRRPGNGIKHLEICPSCENEYFQLPAHLRNQNAKGMCILTAAHRTT